MRGQTVALFVDLRGEDSPGPPRASATLEQHPETLAGQSPRRTCHPAAASIWAANHDGGQARIGIAEWGDEVGEEHDAVVHRNPEILTDLDVVRSGFEPFDGLGLNPATEMLT